MSQREVSNPGTLHVVATPIGNLEDITLRALEVLAQVDHIAAEDTRRTRRLLTHYGISTPLVSLHEHNEHRRIEQITGWLQAGRSVALVSDAGTPLLSDPGFPLVRACRRLGLPVSPVPGPSALTAALSVAGLPVDAFCFHGFLPRQPGPRRERLAALAESPVTLVFYESSHRIRAALEAMAEVLGQERPAVVARELTKRHEEILDGPLGTLAEKLRSDPERCRGEFVVLVAPAPAGAAARPGAAPEEVLEILLESLPVKQAVALAARITGQPRNRLYRLALERR